jgi:hypothetical protein
MKWTTCQAILIGVFVLPFCIGCQRNVLPTVERGNEYQRIVDSFEQLIPKFEFREYNHEAIRKLFDIKNYFNVLKNVSVRDGYYVDYVYCAMPRYGRPYIYARKKGESNLSVDTACSILEGVIWESEVLEGLTTQYLEEVEADGTAMGFFQWVVLYLLGDQFFLFDHALYHDERIICTKEKLESVLAGKIPFGHTIPENAKKEARKIDVTPVIETVGNNTEVKIVTFSKWKGFRRRTFVFLNCPQMLIRKETVTLVPYNCGIQF